MRVQWSSSYLLGLIAPTQIQNFQLNQTLDVYNKLQMYWLGDKIEEGVINIVH